ncbi:hypothetical protein PHISCL_06425 [Aspergillus sclerotialis]|uniref:Secretory lipase n=1 Tax=Aspergillus sclerotialis TaxID=2070753 RepID=A0A3A2ZG50_9EURO|nr:hypothetical protein PHISCL_06425 [Aspergillus sclerotialis]
MRGTPFFIGLCSLLSSQFSHAARPNDLNFTAEEVEKYGCGEKCQANLREGMKTDREIFGGYPFDHDFYAIASNFSDAKPGDVLKFEPFNVSTLSIPPDLTAYRIQYVSTGMDGENVPATAFITLPYMTYPGQKPRLMAFAHGTIGVTSSCAPSSSYNFYDYYTWIMLAIAGYAVVGTDYTGLGNNYTAHKYVNCVLNSEDTYWSVIAARRAFPNTFTKRWAAMGHSQGGGAVWGLSENPRVTGSESGEYIGGVALAPSARVFDLSLESAKYHELSGEAASAKFMPLIAKGIQAVNPPSTKIDFLSDAAEKRSELIDKLQLCLQGSGSVTEDLPLAGVKSPTAFQNSDQLKDFQKKYGAAQGKKAFRDLLVLQGMADETVNYNATKIAYRAACEAGNSVRLSLYPGLDHRPVLTASVREWMPWLDERFRGVASQQKCVMHTWKPLLGE